MLSGYTLLIPRHLAMIFLAIALLLLLPGNVWARSTHNFSLGSLEEIVSSRNGHSFVLVFWSLECPSCLKELDFFNEQLTLHPDLDLVMVSTDDSNRKEAVEAMLAKHNLDTLIDSWVFSDASAQKIRYEIDPGWFGEMPRSYFYDTEHKYKALSGMLTKEHFDGWRTVVRPMKHK